MGWQDAPPVDAAAGGMAKPAWQSAPAVDAAPGSPQSDVDERGIPRSVVPPGFKPSTDHVENPSGLERILQSFPAGAEAGAGMALAGTAASKIPQAGAMFERYARPVIDSLTPKSGTDLLRLLMGSGAAASTGEVGRQVAEQSGAGPTGQAIGQMAGSMALPGASMMPGARQLSAVPEQMGAKRLAGEEARLATEASRNAPKDAIRREAQAAGLATPPEGKNLLEGIAGQAKMEKIVSNANQPKIQQLIKDQLKIPTGQAITTEELNRVRSEAAKPREEILRTAFDSGATRPTSQPGMSGMGVVQPRAGFAPTPQFKQELNSKIAELDAKVHGDMSETYKSLTPSLKLLRQWANKDSFKPPEVLDSIRQLRADASANFKSYDNPAKVGLAHTQRDIADTLETLIEENLARAGKPDLAKQWREGRTRMAQTYDVEAALNDATGEIDPQKLAALADKRPLSGQLDLIARYARAFPSGAQRPKAVAPVSLFDFRYSMAAHPVAAATLLGSRYVVPKLGSMGALQYKPTYSPGLPYTAGRDATNLLTPPPGTAAGMAVAGQAGQQ